MDCTDMLAAYLFALANNKGSIGVLCIANHSFVLLFLVHCAILIAPAVPAFLINPSLNMQNAFSLVFHRLRIHGQLRKYSASNLLTHTSSMVNFIHRCPASSKGVNIHSMNFTIVLLRNLFTPAVASACQEYKLQSQCAHALSLRSSGVDNDRRQFSANACFICLSALSICTKILTHSPPSADVRCLAIVEPIRHKNEDDKLYACK
eukprot:6171993-Pleurochrysis_carterae.AAC.1